MNKISDSEKVTIFISKLSPEISETVSLIRNIILDAHPLVAEEIKWNNPCFYYSGEMAPYNPKEYKREIAVFNLLKNRLMLVLPSGAKVKGYPELLQGDFKDQRKTIIFSDKEDVLKHKETLQQLIKDWISLIDK